MSLQASAWLSNEDSDEYWAEGAKCRVEVEVTDADEIRVATFLEGETSEVSCFYVSRTSADKLARFLAAAVVSDVRIGAPRP